MTRQRPTCVVVWPLDATPADRLTRRQPTEISVKLWIDARLQIVAMANETAARLSILSRANEGC
jgi:hypothetical protein